MKIIQPTLRVALATSLCALSALAQTPPNATTATSVVAESSVQYSATGATSFTNYIGSSGVAYDKVKYSTTAPCKTYLKFDFTGQNPNTNYALKLSLPVVVNNAYQHLQVWALNQAYPGFTGSNPSLTWSGAQANNTCISCNDMLTIGNPSATWVNDFVDTGGGTGSQGATIPAPWGQYLINNQLVVVLTATNDAANSANGARFAMNSVTASFQPLTSGTKPPTISPIPNMTVRSTSYSGPVAFTVSDPLDAAATLTNITISLGNTNVSFTSSNIVIGAAGNRTLSFTPVSNMAPGQSPSVTVTVTITDNSGNSATSSFLLTVSPFVSLPVVLSGTNINYIPPTNRVGTGSLTIPFQVVDTNIPAASLVVTGAVSAYSTNLGSLTFTSVAGVPPYTNNCTVTVNAIGSGVGIITLYVTDPVNSVSNTLNLAVMVLPDGIYAACDWMNYQPSTSYASSSGHGDLLNVSAGLWAARSTAGSVNLITTVTPSSGGVVPVGVPLIRGSASGNQNELRLAGAPFAAGSHRVLYASVDAQWADLSIYGANAVYPGNSTGGFVEFAADANATGVSMAAVCTVTNPANTSTTDGQFYLALYNGSNSPSINTTYAETIPNWTGSGVLPNPTPDNIVVSYDVDTGISTLWVNQPNSAGTSVTLQDVAVTNLANVSYVVLRQNAGMGNIIINDVKVKVVTKPIPVIVGIASASSGTVKIYFTCAPGSGGTASVVGASTVSGTYTTVGGVSISEPVPGSFIATVPVSGAMGFYRIGQSAAMAPISFPF